MTQSEQRLELSTFNGLRLNAAGGEPHGLHAHRKPLALCALLAVERSITRDRAVSLLWSDSEHGRQSLSQALLQLKQELGDGWVEIGRDLIRVADDVWCDAIAFEAALHNGRRDVAFALYEGPFLAGFDPRAAAFEQWLDRRAAHYSILLRDAMRHAIAEAVARRSEDALRHARRWAQVAPSEDEAQHRLIELLAAAGHRSEALHEFDRYRRALEIEGLTPLDETLGLVESIRRGDTLSPLTTMLRADARASAPRTRRLGGLAVDGPRLVRIVDGGVEAESYYLRAGITRVGAAAAEISFPGDPLLDSLHASIEMVPPTSEAPVRIVLRDEASSTGVYLRVRGSWPLRHGDQFRVGQQQFRFELPSAVNAT